MIGLDIAGFTIEVSDPNLISNSMIMNREQFEEQVENLKKSLTSGLSILMMTLIIGLLSIQIKMKTLRLYCKIYLLTIGKLRVNC